MNEDKKTPDMNSFQVGFLNEKKFDHTWHLITTLDSKRVLLFELIRTK